MKHTRQDLNIMQGWSLEEKIKVSQMKILEWYREYNGQVFTSFSGGKDSTVLLDLARQVCPDIPAVYVDTGLEYPELRDFVKTKDNVIWLRPRYPFTQIIEKYGYGISTVKRALDELVEASYITKQARFDERKNGGQTSNLYTLCAEAPQPPAPEQPTEPEPPMPDEEVEKAEAVHSSAPDSTPGEQSALFLFPAYSFVNGFERKTRRQKCRPDAAWTGGQSIFVPP